jgi:hypothetical protein
MKFAYQKILVRGVGPASTEKVFRPIIPVRIHGNRAGASELGLVDTGCDDTLFPIRLAPLLGVGFSPGDYSAISGIDGGSFLVRYAQVDLELRASGESLRWSARVGFHPLERVVLGHSGFLDYFTASFNGRRRLLTLTANGQAPASSIA